MWNSLCGRAYKQSNYEDNPADYDNYSCDPSTGHYDIYSILSEYTMKTDETRYADMNFEIGGNSKVGEFMVTVTKPSHPEYTRREAAFYVAPDS
jgi:hypothetical protein